MNTQSNKKVRPGVALLVVLFIVMAITILSLGFVARSDVELACGQNMLLRTKMDYLAESGLEHARGLILNPQDVNTVYWDQPKTFQLTDGSNDYYEVNVDRDTSDLCDYTIDCNSYRLDGADTIGQSSLRAVLRIDPCIAYWVGSGTTVSSATTINGDVYCGGNLTNNGFINGDAFAANTITGTNIEGQSNTFSQAPVDWPNLSSASFEPIKDDNILTDMQGSYTGIWYGPGDVIMPGNVTVTGTLVVTGNLTIDGSNTITAAKNFPALIVDGQVVMKENSSLVINGLAQIGEGISIDTGNADIEVTGGLFINNGGVSDSITVNVYADPSIASIDPSSTPGISARWSPAAGAFFRSIERR